jgi:hypothetical protein
LLSLTTSRCHIRLKKALGINGIYSTASSWLFKGNEVLAGCRIDMIIDRADQTNNLCEAKFTKENYAIYKKLRFTIKNEEIDFRASHANKKSNVYYFAYYLSCFKKPLLFSGNRQRNNVG